MGDRDGVTQCPPFTGLRERVADSKTSCWLLSFSDEAIKPSAPPGPTLSSPAPAKLPCLKTGKAASCCGLRAAQHREGIQEPERYCRLLPHVCRDDGCRGWGGCRKSGKRHPKTRLHQRWGFPPDPWQGVPCGGQLQRSRQEIKVTQVAFGLQVQAFRTAPFQDLASLGWVTVAGQRGSVFHLVPSVPGGTPV